jgi:hypothetical protein
VYLLTASITELGKDEAWFWGSEPRLVFYLVEEKKKIDLEKMKAQGAYVAMCVWGKNPDELDDDGGEILGIDKPASPEMLKGWY